MSENLGSDLKWKRDHPTVRTVVNVKARYDSAYQYSPSYPYQQKQRVSRKPDVSGHRTARYAVYTSVRGSRPRHPHPRRGVVRPPPEAGARGSVADRAAPRRNTDPNGAGSSAATPPPSVDRCDTAPAPPPVCSRHCSVVPCLQLRGAPAPSTPACCAVPRRDDVWQKGGSLVGNVGRPVVAFEAKSC